MKRFLIMPSDHATGEEIIHRYGLDPAECVIREADKPFFGEGSDEDTERHLLPLGALDRSATVRDYIKHLESLKYAAFHRYHKARKLAVFNEERRRPEFAKRNRHQAERLEATWPDFPAAYERMEKQR